MESKSANLTWSTVHNPAIRGEGWMEKTMQRSISRIKVVLIKSSLFCTLSISTCRIRHVKKAQGHELGHFFDTLSSMSILFLKSDNICRETCEGFLEDSHLCSSCSILRVSCMPCECGFFNIYCNFFLLHDLQH